MGDGGVACVPSQHVMERFPISDTFCGGNGGFNSKLQFAESQLQRKHEKKMEVEKEEFSSEKGRKFERGKKGEVEKAEIVSEKLSKEEVEEGELGSLQGVKGEVENGEFVPEKSRRKEIENGEFVPDKSRKGGEVEKGEFVPDKWRKGEVEKGEHFTGRARKEIEKGEFILEKGRRGEVEKSDLGRGRRGEIEKGEFIPEKWRKSEVVKEDYGSAKGWKWEMDRDDTAKDRGWKYERARTPPSMKFSDEDASRRREFSRSGSERRKRSSSSRWDNGHDRDSKTSSRILDEELGSCKHEYSDGKNHGRERTSGTWLKRHYTESEGSSRKYHGEDYPGSKSRRISDDSNRAGHEKHYSRGSQENSYRNSSSSSSRVPSSSRFSSRHYDSSLPSRVVHDRHGRSPAHSERSPHDRGRHYDHRDRSPGRSDRSPHDRSHHHDYKNRSPAHVERSPRDRTRYHDQRDDRRDRTPGYQERLPHDRGRPLDYQKSGQKSGGSERQQSRYANQGNEEKLGQRESAEKDSHKHSSTSQPPNSRTVHSSGSGSADKNINVQCHKEEELQNVSMNSEEPPFQVNEAPEELLSMEEDMDISDTPPHVPVISDSNAGKWFYLDHSGIEQGPSKLCDLTRLVEEGFMLSDHLIKHSESNRWVSVENAVSPLVPVNFPSVVSDAISKLVSPPEAPGNLLSDVADAGQSVDQQGEELPASSMQPLSHLHDISSPLEPLEDLHIDERVGALLTGYTFITGRELETLGEALQMTFEHADWENWGSSEGFTRFQPSTGYSTQRRDENFDRSLDSMSKEATDTRTTDAFASADYIDWFSSLWSCKGGDWKRNDEASQDRTSKKKLVLNDGYPMCQMPKSVHDDPRWHRKEELYYPSQSRRLDLPPWAFSWPEEKNDCKSMSRSGQIKPLVAKGVRGTMLSVIRINACVLKDHGSFISEPHMRIRGNERLSSRSHRSFSRSSDDKNSSAEGRSRKHSERDLQGLQKGVTPIRTPKDHVCTVDELQLHLGDWYYFDGSGHEHGPLSFSKLQAMVDKGNVPKSTSVFRKDDNTWVPVVSAAQACDGAPVTDSSVTESQVVAQSGDSIASGSFHSVHPQFIGYTRGKLHELVMKSFKSREFAAAINEVLDPWINAKQPKKELDKQPFTSAVTRSSFSQNFAMYKFQKSEDEASCRAGKRAWMVVDESEEDDEIEEDLLIEREDDCSFEELCGDTVFNEGNGSSAEVERETWGLLNGNILARVFHFLRADLKSLAFSAATCKRWNAAVRFYRDISRQINFSLAGPKCTDSMFRCIMDGYKKEKITSVILVGCTNISAGALEGILHLFPCISSIDIRGCRQFRELAKKFPNLNWIKSRVCRDTKNLEETHSKIRSVSQITEKSFSVSKAFKGTSIHLDDSSERGDSLDRDVTADRRDTVGRSFRQSYYRRTKLCDVKMPTSLLSRDAQLRWLLRKKSENGYKRMEEFLALSLRDIMKENTFDFFVPKVAEIEDRMKNGYYIGHGLTSVKEDIRRMCRDAIKARNRGDAGDMNQIIMLFIRLARSLDENSKSSRERDEIMKKFKDSAPAGLCSVVSKYGKKLNKTVNERKIMRNGTSYINGGIDYVECASDREIRRRLSKLNKRDIDSGSEISDDPDQSSEGSSEDGNCSSSDTESDLGFQSEGGTGDLSGDRFFGADDSVDSIADDREWGARMTKASLVPPVTRKYEVIDQYVIVADVEEVQRKMQVCLPDDYSEKVKAQKNITEDSDMEIPEVKDYKPRKQLGNEVLEQEVYGIDPYTHNLLLDSMPDDSDWTLLDKHIFVEEVLLRVLNKQVRSFTGSGNTPMTYPLQRVVEEILKTAQEGGDKRIVKMCQCILMSMEDRRDNYVAYRKGLGVVCNNEGGFGEDDFVVEFLGEVYPAWKWFEKQDGIRLLQKNNNDPAPEFYNIYLERPKGDRDGYDLVVVDAMHKANYASRICHSCRPNCEAKVTAVDGRYLIGVYTVRPISYGEEITFDYNSVTESKEEYEASVCLCGSQVCRGSYLNLTGEGAFQKILKESHGMLDRHQLMLEACELNSVSEDDYMDLGRAGVGACLLDCLPDWLIAYSARLVRFINFERTKLPEEILKHNLEEKRKFFLDICLDTERSDAEVQAEGVYNQRLQNLAVSLDKVRYVMRSVFGDPKKAPPPLEKLSPEEVVSVLWKGEGSLVDELLQCMAPHVEENLLNDLKSKIDVHKPSGSDDLRTELKKSLLWLRDEVRNLPCTYKCRNDAAADLIHIYAHTKCFFRVREYKTLTSPPVYISPLDLGPKYTDKLGSGFQEYRKTYGENYCLGQLIYWHIQTNADPDCKLGRGRRGCLLLPDIASFYADAQKPSVRQRVYGPRTLRFMLTRMEKQPQRPWPEDRIWSFKSGPRVFGSPMLDAVLKKSPLDKEMLHWLKSRPAVFQAMWDQ